MADQASDFMKQSQALAQQSWEQWMRYLQQSGARPHSFGSSETDGGAASAGEALERGYEGIKRYLDWMQQAAGGSFGPSGTDWQAQVRRLFGDAGQPFSQAFDGIDSTAAQGFIQQWQAWLVTTAQDGPGMGLPGLHMPAFGLQREQLQHQQAMVAAMLESLEQQRRYQALLARANAQGLERLKDKLAQHAEPGREIESLKALYDLWIDAAEEAYADIALSDEFQAVYGAMVNAQMHQRQLQQRQLEDYCRQWGMPTRSEVDSLGRRLQEVRRELRAGDRAAHSRELAGLRAEVAALSKQLSDATGAPQDAGAAVPPASSGGGGGGSAAPIRRATKKQKAKSAPARKVEKSRATAGKAAGGEPSAAPARGTSATTRSAPKKAAKRTTRHS